MGIATLEFLHKKDSTSSEGSDFCRICHCGAEVEELISPCHCSGSLGFIHQSCLQEWLGSTNKKVCELCRYEFKLQATLRPLSKWRLLSLSRYERRKIVCSVTFHLLAITCVVWSIWVLLQRLIQESQQETLGWAFWTKIVVVIIGFIGGLSFVFAQVKMYYNLIKRWRSFNKIILVVNKSDSENSISVDNQHGNQHGDIMINLQDHHHHHGDDRYHHIGGYLAGNLAGNHGDQFIGGIQQDPSHGGNHGGNHGNSSNLSNAGIHGDTVQNDERSNSPSNPVFMV